MTAIYHQRKSAFGSRTAARCDRPAAESLALPRVQYGWYRDREGKHAPLWAYSLLQLEEEERTRAELLKLLWPPDAEIHARLRRQYAQLRAEFAGHKKSYDQAIQPPKERLAEARPPAEPRRPVKAPLAAGAAAQRAVPLPVSAPAAPQAVPAPTETARAKLADVLKELEAPDGFQSLCPAGKNAPEPSKLEKVGAPARAAASRLKLVELLKELEELSGFEISRPAGKEVRELAKSPEAAAPAPAQAGDGVKELGPSAGISSPVVQDMLELAKHPRVAAPRPTTAPAKGRPAKSAPAKSAPSAAPQIPAASPKPQRERSSWFKTSYRSRWPCPVCGGQTHYAANLGTMLSGLYRNACKSCAYRGPTLIKIHKADKQGPLAG